MGDRKTTSMTARYATLVVAVVVVGLAGFLGYAFYPRFELPAIEGAGLLALAAVAGIASFFSPCSFPLLVTLLGRQTAADAETERSPRPTQFGAALGAGAAVFMLGAGAVIAFGGEALFAGLTFTSSAGVTIRAVAGLVLIVLGLTQAGILHLSMHALGGAAQPLLKRQARLPREHPLSGLALFGFAYVLAGFG